MQIRRLLGGLIMLVGLVGGTAGAQEAYFHVPLKDLALTDGSSSDPESTTTATLGRGWRRFDLLLPRPTLAGPGEAYYLAPEGQSFPLQAVTDGAVVIRLPAPREVRGRLLLPKADWSGMTARSFTIPASQATATAQGAFYRAKQEYYEIWAARSVAGAAWFRYQADETRRALEQLAAPPAVSAHRPTALWRRPRVSELDDTYALVSGGRALSENLQLDRLLPPVRAQELTVDVASLAGITTAALDWKALLQSGQPATDPLAALLPADQHALFFTSFHAMLTLLDEADAHGTPVLHLLEPRAEDARTRQRYERQLGLSMRGLSRLLGPAVISSVAFTGSDPFLRMGSDVAILFETKTPEVLLGFLRTKHTAIMQEYPSAHSLQGELHGVSYTALVSPDRTISSYVAAHEKVVLVTNSLPQLRRVLETAQGKAPALAASEEYLFFRQRYARTDKEETAFLLLTDATIRRWCSPVWRIADSRRTRAAAALADTQARIIAARAHGMAEPLPTTLNVPEAGTWRMTPTGPVSEPYGSLDFLTPIIELPLTKVSAEEARVYERFRNAYQQNWRQFFDPIAIRFALRPAHLGIDITVMPLIANTEYRDFIEVTRGVELHPHNGDPHPEALWHVVMALNPASFMMQRSNNMVASLMPGLTMHPLGWLGNAVAVYADADPMWETHLQALNGAQADAATAFVELPIAVHAEVKNALGLTALLTALRALVEQSAPGMTHWETLQYKNLPYVKVSPTERALSAERIPQKMALYYAAGGGALVLTLSEALLHRALERQAAHTPAAPGVAAVPGWLGKSLGLRVTREAVDVLAPQWKKSYWQAQQDASWDNLPILNEWKRLFPDEDPVQLHTRLWGTTLQCPGGGTYIWNETWQTMESTVYGHPANPKSPETGLPPPLAAMLSATFGLTFEQDGLRVQAELQRQPRTP